MSGKLSLMLNDEREVDIDARGAAVSVDDSQLLSDMAEAFGNLGLVEEVALLDELGERGIYGRFDELCALGARMVAGLDRVAARAKREVFEVLDLAVRVFSRVVDGDASVLDGYRLLALSCMILGRGREAVDVTRRWEAAFGDERDSGFRDVLIVRGVAQVFGGLAAEAAFTFARAIRLFPEAPEIKFCMGLTYLVLGDGEKCAGEIVGLSGIDAAFSEVLAELSRKRAISFTDVVLSLEGAQCGERFCKVLGFSARA